MPKIFDRALTEIQRGMEGLNKGLPIPFERLRRYLPNIQQKTYYLLGAQTKVGKTALADDLFFYSPLDYIMQPDVEETAEWHYWSFEIDAVSKIAKAITRKLWYDYGVYIDTSTILSKGDRRLTPEIYEKVMELRHYFEALEDHLHIYEAPENPTGIFKKIQQIAKENGTFHYRDVEIQDEGVTKTIKIFDHYVPHNPKKYIFLVFDHIGLAKGEKGRTDTKSIIDAISQDCVQARNNYGFIPVVIQQLSFAAEAPERYQQKRLTPQLSDFSDSRYTSRDANTILALFNPMAYKLSEFNGYNTAKLGDNFRSLEILRNRDGEPFVTTGLLYYGKIGSFQELPHAEDAERMKRVYERLSDLKTR